MTKDEDTRDIAVEARTMVEHHMTDCVQFREALRGDMREFRDEFRRLNYRIAMMLGGLVILSRAAEFFFQMAHK